MSTIVPTDPQLAYLQLKLEHKREMYKAETDRQRVNVEVYKAKTLRWALIIQVISLAVWLSTGHPIPAPLMGCIDYIFKIVTAAEKPADK